MSERVQSQITQSNRASVMPVASGILQRKCACGTHTMGGGECADCAKKKNGLQRKLAIGASNDPLEQEADRIADQVMAAPMHSHVNAIPFRIQRFTGHATGEMNAAPASVGRVLASSGRPLEPALQRDMGQRFGYDFSHVRVHTGAAAEQSALDVSAHAYTVGHNIVFGAGQFEPGTSQGQQLLAHELTHVVQQVGADGIPGRQGSKEQGLPIISPSSLRIARLCTPAATCSAPIPGSAGDFGTGEEAIEVGPRGRRRRMTPARAVSSGHSGRARQLERFLTSQDPTRLSNIQGIFIDSDMSPGTGALTQDCAAWIADSLPAGTPTPPGMAGATKPCTFVHGNLNQEALIFNTRATPTIGGLSREQWRVDTLQILTHETEHPRFETATAAAPLPPGVTTATCSRANVLRELSEIAAGLSEFKPLFRAVSGEADPAGPLHTRMNEWFHEVAITGGESFHGALTKMGCSCDCTEIDAHVRATFTEVTTSNGWTPMERLIFNLHMQSELPFGRRPSWPLVF
ncbi:MAG: DUF4157 domain-containing protein [Nitrospira sp.]